MNKVAVGIIGVVSVVIIIVVILLGSASATLDQILASKDCTALEKWGEDHIYDDNLDITDEQKKKILSVGMECAGKAIQNMFGS